MKIFIGNINFVQNSVNDLKLSLTSAPSMLEFDVAGWYFYYDINRAKMSPTTSGYPVVFQNWTFCGPGHHSRSL